MSKRLYKQTAESIIDSEGLDDYTEKSPVEVETNGPETINGTIINSFTVRMRRDPSFESDVLEVLSGGTKVKILDTIGEFYKILYRKRIGFIASKFIKED